jgi:hypothetical protein
VVFSAVVQGSWWAAVEGHGRRGWAWPGLSASTGSTTVKGWCAAALGSDERGNSVRWDLNYYSLYHLDANDLTILQILIERILNIVLPPI